MTLLLLQLQEALQVRPNIKFEGCSSKVAAALGPDVMKSVKHLIPDLLSALPILLYQGLSNALTHIVAGSSDCLCMQEHYSRCMPSPSLEAHHSNAMYACSWYNQ